MRRSDVEDADEVSVPPEERPECSPRNDERPKVLRSSVDVTGDERRVENSDGS